MKKLNIFTIAFTFTGCFLGAGFVSGQELWQFFGTFGLKCIPGMSVAALLLAFLGFIVMRLAKRLETGEMDKLIIMYDSRLIRSLFSFLEIFFLFGIFVVMTAGMSSLFEQLFDITPYITGIVFVLIVFAVAIMGTKGLTTSFSVTVPLLAVMSLLMFILSAKTNGIYNFDTAQTVASNKVPGNWLVSAFVYASYNFFAAIGVLCPLGTRIENSKRLACGVLLGAVFMGIIAYSIIFTVSASPNAVDEALPMLKAAENLGTAYKYIFAFLLFAGMFGASLTSVFAITEFTRIKVKTENKNKASTLSAFVACVLALSGSLIGFDKLISTFYPVCGNIGFAAIGMLLFNYIRIFRREHQQKNPQ